MSAKTLALVILGTFLFVVCGGTTHSASDDARIGARVAAERPGGAPAPGGLAALPQDDCFDSIENCKPPVKYTGSKGECACFACEYGKSTQHYVCTKNKPDKDTLFKKAQPRSKR
jgi:hypothetical protein